MFKIPQVNVIESDEGFSVEVLGRVGLLYTEGPKSLLIDSEILAGPSGVVIYKNSIRAWKPPFDTLVIDNDQRDKIIDNIQRAFQFRGFNISII